MQQDRLKDILCLGSIQGELRVPNAPAGIIVGRRPSRFLFTISAEAVCACTHSASLSLSRLGLSFGHSISIAVIVALALSASWSIRPVPSGDPPPSP